MKRCCLMFFGTPPIVTTYFFPQNQATSNAIEDLTGRLLDGHRLSARLMEPERLRRQALPVGRPSSSAEDPQCRVFVANLPEEVTVAVGKGGRRKFLHF